MTNTINVPEWVKDAVFYQIFPDRFAKSDSLSKPANLEPWDSPPTGQGYKGGDLLGVVEKLDYLAGLGINALYFNPIFQSACNHRYHTHDYYNVDPLLGGNEALRTLVEEAHLRGLRVVLDGVFNHASRGFFQFSDILENGPHSPYIDWFLIEEWPLAPYDGSKPANFVGWADNRALPKFNTDNPEVREFIMQVAEFWLREYEIDGWRLDVPAEVTTPGFWEEFRRRVRAVNSEAYIVGEIWEASPEWLQGDRFDALMNYPFTEAAIAYLGGDRVHANLAREKGYAPYPAIDAAEFDRRMRRLLDIYPWEVTQVQLNSLDSHDTPRLLNLVGEDKSTVHLATLLQMCYPGAPCIYYGDEIGLRGTTDYDARFHDKDARWPFPWQDQSVWDIELLAFFKEVIALRHEHPALRRGQLVPLLARGAVYAFARISPDEKLLVVLNAAEEAAEVNLAPPEGWGSGHLQRLFGSGSAVSAEEGHIALTLPARSGAVWSAANE